MEENLCLSCGRPNPDSLKIFEAYLCPECEANLMKSEAGKVDYQHWIDSCRRLWVKISSGLGEVEQGE